MKKIIILFYLCFFSYYIFSQNDCQIGNSLEIKSENINQNYIQEKIAEEKLMYKEADITNIKKRIDNCNENMDANLSLIKQKINKNFLNIQEVFANRDIKDLKNHIDGLEKSKKEAKIKLENSLSKQTSYTGLFLVVLKNTDYYDKKEDLVLKAEKAVKNTAIENLLGTHIKRVTESDNFQNINDVITSINSDKIHYEAPEHQKDNETGIFVFFTRIEMSPFIAKLNKTNNSHINISDATAIDIQNEPDYISKLQTLGIGKDIIDYMKEKINQQFKTIKKLDKFKNIILFFYSNQQF